MYIVVVGAGTLGRPFVEMATVAGNEVVVVERDEAAADAVAREYDCLVVRGDATVAGTLADAGAGRADAIVSTTGDDATNVMVMLLADEFGVASRVSVVHRPEHLGLFREIGAHVVENPQRLIADYLYRAAQRPSIRDVLHLAGDAEVFEITVTPDAPLANLTLADADGRGLLGGDGVLVVAVERDGEALTPQGETTLRPGDLVTVFSKHGFDPSLLSQFAPREVAP